MRPSLGAKPHRLVEDPQALGGSAACDRISNRS